jgi:hypothetical protein
MISTFIIKAQTKACARNSNMELISLERPLNRHKRSFSIQFAVAALFTLAAANTVVLLQPVLDGNLEPRRLMSSAFGWLFAVMLLVTAIRLWSCRGKGWRGIRIGAAMIGGFLFTVPLIGTLNGQFPEMWPAYLFLICEGALFFVVVYSLGRRGAREYLARHDRDSAP